MPLKKPQGIEVNWIYSQLSERWWILNDYEAEKIVSARPYVRMLQLCHIMVVDKWFLNVKCVIQYDIDTVIILPVYCKEENGLQIVIKKE